MAREWQVVSLVDLVDIFDGPHATPSKTDAGPIFLGISNLVSGRLDLSSTEHLSEKDFIKWTRRVTPRVGDVVFSYETRLGEAALVPAGLRCCLGRRMGLLRPKSGRVHSRFLLYAYIADEFQNTIRDRTIPGSTVDRIPLIEMPSFPIRVPSFGTQRAIAHILGTLDDKIELNRRMNQTLEGMARALFKSWFVDFDPVRAKAEGRDTGLPVHLANLFPDRFDDSDQGEIPAGWSVDNLGELIDLAYGKALRERDRRPGSVPVYGSNGQIGWHDQKLVDGPGIVVGRKGNPGFVKWAPTDFFPIDTTFFVEPKSESESLYYLLYALEALDLPSLSADSAVPGLNRNMAYMSTVLRPEAPVLSGFDNLIDPFFRRRFQNDEESSVLAAHRDVLLPKLLSGELRVVHPERIAGTESS